MGLPNNDSRHRNSRALFERAERVIPGGIYGHQTPQMLTRDRFPFFLADAEGCRIRDVDGNEYIDFLCGFGPVVLGYRHAKVEEAAERQRRQCDTMNLPAPVMVELAERLVSVTPGAAWSVFAKNGGDVTTWALAVAREATGRDLVAMVDHTYHGTAGWCNPFGNGFPDGERAGMRAFQWNDAASLRALIDREGASIAAVIVTPFRHEAFEDSQLPANEFLSDVRRICDENGSVMIVDDVRAGFRIDIGGSTQRWGVTPDLLVYSKALANGYPLSAMIGADALRDAARAVFVTGTTFTQAVPIAAALATLEELERTDGIAHMDRMGRRLCDGLLERATAVGVEVRLSGPPSIPYMSFVDDESDFARSKLWAGACADAGAFFHPLHNWFISVAHAETDIDEALDAAERGFSDVRAAF
jgi:glutamate-1-semialdehyde 2,1-aminomutase